MKRIQPIYYNVFRDGMLLATRVENVARYIHNRHCYSLDHAVKHEGYSYEVYENHVASIIGRRAICAETKLPFIIAQDGCSLNYASDKDSNVISDAGVDIRERRELLDTSKPFFAYVGTTNANQSPEYITGWKGNKLMRVVIAYQYRLSRFSYTHGSFIYSIVAQDDNGQFWYGRGNEGIAIKMRAYKNNKR